MKSPEPLSASRLRANCDPQKIPWNDSREINVEKLLKSGKTPFQPRAMQALEMALRIREAGYNIYVSGEAEMGRSYMALSFLRPYVATAPPAPDLVYVRNFADSDAPSLLKLPTGTGKKLKEMIGAFLGDIKSALRKYTDTLNYVSEKARIADKFHANRLTLMRKMKAIAATRGYNLEFDDEGGLSISPLDDDKNVSGASAGVAQELASLMHRLGKVEATLHEDEKTLESGAVSHVIEDLYKPLRQKLLKICGPVVGDYLEALKRDMLDNAVAFLPAERQMPSENFLQDNFFKRYEINLFVDNSGSAGAPLIVETNPTPVNLLGCMERESEMGALVTDFTLVRAGSLQRANGGFLILHVEDLLQHPLAFEGLLRALRVSRASIEDNLEAADGIMRTKSPRPEPLDLDLKVVLVGNDEIYEALIYDDERFAKLFRIRAQMTESCDRNSANIRAWLAQIAVIISEANLAPFDRSALAWLVDLGSHLEEDQKKLSLRFSVLRQLMIEGNALASMRGAEMVDAPILEEAWKGRTFRANLGEEQYMEEYDREMIKLETSGEAVGQINGLSVTYAGDFEFGLPHRISCTVGVGHDGIIDLEREAELGGPIHTKAMMILKSYLTGVFARKKPLVLSASLHFEQSYAGIEGDSASGAELAALISALAQTPMRLDLAFTGAVSQSGQIMAVGGVSRKVEGFYRVCARQGLTGAQGVIIPYDNIDHLMLSSEVLKSAANGEFSIYPVRKIEEALQLLSGLPAGRPLKNGGFTRGSLYDLVDKRLTHLGCHAQGSFRKPRND